ncbi:MAG TPA: preprotein translocase subunit SecE [Bryobacteraceae bacterium]|jgi:preprotein translocase subunit SecE|nr:preprotein translocase subunit SecE [Bryobacteraceae bacterium]
MAGELESKRQSWIEDTRAYIGDIRSEMKRVTWPTRDRVESTTLVVLVSVFIFAAYFEMTDAIFQRLVTLMDKTFLK